MSRRSHPYRIACLVVALAIVPSVAGAVAVPISRNECSTCTSSGSFFPDLTTGTVQLGGARFEITPEGTHNVCCVRRGGVGLVYPNVANATAIRVLVNAHELASSSPRLLGHVHAIFDDGSSESTELVLGSTVRPLGVQADDPNRHSPAGLRSGTTQLFPVRFAPSYRLDMVTIGLSRADPQRKLVAVAVEGHPQNLTGNEKLLVFGVNVVAPRSMVAFQSGSKVYLSDDEGEERTLLADVGGCQLGALSPDGTTLTLACGTGPARSLHLYDIPSGTRQTVYTGRFGKVRFSDDSSRVVLYDLDRFEILALDRGSGHVETLLRVKSRDDVEPTLAPDGRSVAYSLRGDLFVATPGERRGRAIMRARRFKVSNGKTLLREPLFDRAGARVIFERRLSAHGTYADAAVDSVRVADGDVSNLVASAGRAPDRNSTGTAIGVRRPDGPEPGSSHLAVVNHDGSRPRRIADEISALALGPIRAGTCNNCLLNAGEQCETGLGEDDDCRPLGSCPTGCDVETCTCAPPPPPVPTPPLPTPTLLPVAPTPGPPPPGAPPQPPPAGAQCSAPGSPWVCRRIVCREARVFTGYSPSGPDLQNPVGMVYNGEVYPTHRMSGDTYAARIIYRGQYLNILHYCIGW